MSLKRLLIVVHRWLGVALSPLFALWFASGIGMMYWDFPSVTPADRLERSPALEASGIRIPATVAVASLGGSPPSAVRLNTFDGRPVYRVRINGVDEIVYADTGERQLDVSNAMALRIASAWVAQPASAAKVAILDEADQWTVQTVRGLRPLTRFAWPNGDQVYVSSRSGEIVQFTTPTSRLQAYLGPIPHWLYFTPLRSRPSLWNAVVTWVSGIGAVAAMLGLVLGIWMYSPSRRYRVDGAAVSLPYRGPKRWHAILGLIVGVAAVTWAFSGMLSMEPLPSRRGSGEDEARSTLVRALRGRPDIDAFERFPPSAALARLAGTPIKELELTTFAGDSLYIAHLEGGETRVVTLDGQVRPGFDPRKIEALVTNALTPIGRVSSRLLERYDAYYLDRRHRLPLPVTLITLDDPEQSRLYVDLETATVVGHYSSRDWVSRWLYHGLHSLDFPWLYGHRPLWDIVMIAFMLGGAALSVTSFVLAWQVLGRALARIAS